MTRIYLLIGMLLVVTNLYAQSSVKSDSVAIIRKRGIVEANKISIAYESFGRKDDEAILLIQGTAAQLIAWPESFCKRLANEGFRVIRFDNRDVGLSSKLDSLGMPDWASIIPSIGTCDISKLPYSLKDMSDDAIGLLDALHIQKAHVIGVSMGSAIAQLTAINYPQRMLSLTSIMGSAGNPKAVTGKPDVLKIMATPPPQTNDKEILIEYLTTIFKAISSPGYPTADTTLRYLARRNIERSWYPIGNARQAAAVIIGENCDRRNELRSIQLPSLIIHGTADPVVSIEAGKEIAEAIPQARFVPIPGMGHDLPEALIPIICSEILKTIKPGTSVFQAD